MAGIRKTIYKIGDGFISYSSVSYDGATFTESISSSSPLGKNVIESIHNIFYVPEIGKSCIVNGKSYCALNVHPADKLYDCVLKYMMAYNKSCSHDSSGNIRLVIKFSEEYIISRYSLVDSSLHIMYKEKLISDELLKYIYIYILDSLFTSVFKLKIFTKNERWNIKFY